MTEKSALIGTRTDKAARRALSLIHPLPWWQTGLVYEIYPRSFQDTNADGVGDLDGILKRLDYLSDLGVAAIWLTPIYPSPLFDFGYDVSNYLEVDPVYGSLSAFDDLVHACRSRGIHVVMDLVVNHTSHLHPWFLESRSSRDNPKRDWYIWRDAAAGEELPNNWASVFGGPAWSWDEVTEQFYCHAFLPQQPDLNWANPDVRKAIGEVMRFWTARGTSGFRLDAIAHIGKRPGLPDNPYRRELDEPRVGRWTHQIHLYDLADPVIHGYIRDIRSVADECGAMLIGEIYSIPPTDLATFSGPGQLHSVFNFALLTSPWNASSFKAAADSFSTAFRHEACWSPVLDNHDNSRSFSRYDKPGMGQDRARVAATMLITLPGSPFMYYGQEIGMHDVRIPPERAVDPVGKSGHLDQRGRDPERTPMQWSGHRYAGFSSVEPWLPLPEDITRQNVEAQKADPASLLNLYRELIRLRARLPALSQGGYRSLAVDNDQVFAYVRQASDQTVLIALNLGESEVTADLSGAGERGTELLSTRERSARELNLEQVRLSSTSGTVVAVSG